ncbi:hypothetical protein I6F66_19895 [Pseudoalteromonas sp. NZS100_1]|uniref:hypothetical protein n=1 Tax=Pseudoalteromonas sp. NZS100_1 TaxID=2792073 RepID=UPI0018CF4371|nr:hypothetical protein [Pseudoalteromonas sp. NZS100_1]MBH0014336.1 hypothetical protein [Pseudoalteromonas sp. NZS100_1]
MNKLSPKLAEMTREEWRELGFYYIIDDDSKAWNLYGSVDGLSNFITEILKFTARDEVKGEHEHLLPHWYLTLQYDDGFDICERGILASKIELLIFIDILKQLLLKAKVGEIIGLHNHVKSASYRMYLHVKGADFDPSKLDPQL